MIREILGAPGGVVRLVGLSGVGKTRFAHALFDGDVGSDALDPAMVVYTDLADDPDPQPIGLASDLIAQRTRGILVVDNCAPDLHRRVSEVCSAPGTTVSVLTIEYDVREDQPEGTEVFILEPSSEEIIEQLLQRRFPLISGVDVQTIAKFSGGNARIAIAIAGTIGQRDTVAGLSDEALFQRLFAQRNATDQGLLSIARACSLVYSFDGETLTGPEAELLVLGSLVEKSSEDVFRGVADLLDRELAQKRGIWRAILPHAIANRLAAAGLRRIPAPLIDDRIIKTGPVRLLRSFARRLGYLHDSPEAVAIVDRWLSPRGLLASVADLDELKGVILENVAPVSPAHVVSLFESTLSQPTEDNVHKCKRFMRLLRSLAYEPPLFERCAMIFARLSLVDGEREVPEAFTSLFQIVLSGTHATIEQRLAVIEKLAMLQDSQAQTLACAALKSVLQTSHFSSTYSFEFGARPRDYGFYPRTRDDTDHWFRSALTFIRSMIISGGPVSTEVKRLIGQKFGALWVAGFHEELEGLCVEIGRKGFWADAWVGVRRTIGQHAIGMPDDLKARLLQLEEQLRPVDLVDKVRGTVIASAPGDLDPEEFSTNAESIASAMKRTAAMAEELGNELAVAPDSLQLLLPEVVGGQGQIWPFGRGLALGAPEPMALWKKLVRQLAERPTDQRNSGILGAYLNGLRERDPAVCETLLDEAVQDSVLASHYPALQVQAGVNEKAVQRLIESLTIGVAPIVAYRHLGMGRATDEISGYKLREILLRIAGKANGFGVAIEILHMRLFADRSDERLHDPDLVKVGQELLTAMDFAQSDRDDYALGQIVNSCLAGHACGGTARTITTKLRDAIASSRTHALYHDDLIGGLLKVQTEAVLDELLSDDPDHFQAGVNILLDASYNNKSPFENVPISSILAWCDREPATRFLSLATVVPPIREDANQRKAFWNGLALQLVEKAPAPSQVLERLVQRFKPQGWWGSLATALEARAHLLDQLVAHANPEIAHSAVRLKAQLVAHIEAERHQEVARDKERDERFE